MSILTRVVAFLGSLFKSRFQLVLENLALRQQPLVHGIFPGNQQTTRRTRRTRRQAFPHKHFHRITRVEYVRFDGYFWSLFLPPGYTPPSPVLTS